MKTKVYFQFPGRITWPSIHNLDHWIKGINYHECTIYTSHYQQKVRHVRKTKYRLRQGRIQDFGKGGRSGRFVYLWLHALTKIVIYLLYIIRLKTVYI